MEYLEKREVKSVLPAVQRDKRHVFIQRVIDSIPFQYLLSPVILRIDLSLYDQTDCSH
jgi:hypothetical protein